MDFGVRLMLDGRYKGLPEYEPSVWMSKEGSRITLVAVIDVLDPQHLGGHLCHGLLTGQKFRLQGFDTKVGDKITILGGKVTFNRWPTVCIDEQAQVLVHQPRQLDDVMRVVETCAGIGALGHGALKAGFTICCHNDINPKFCDHLRSIDAPHVVEGDIAKLSTVAQIHAHAPNASTLAFGFSCQPFSKLGDQRHGNDQRAQSLPSALYAAFLLQMDTLVLECVPEASTSVFVQKCMDQYLECTRSTRSETLLELSDLWPAKRKRWWSIIVKDYVGQMRLEPLPKLEMTPTIRCVLPYFLSLSDEELRQLTLTPEERGMFTRFGRGLGTQLVEANMPLATSLHAWGNQCQDCACGCRPAFSEHRLQHMGLYGALIHVGGRTPDTDLRHISPKEMALLNGFAKQDGWEASQRLLMAGIGQLASPVQSSWIFGILRNHLAEGKLTSFCIRPAKEILQDVFTELFELVQVLLAKHHTEVVEICSPEQVRVAPGLTVSPRTTVTAGEATLMVTESHSEQGTLTFAQAHSLEVGDVLIQTAHHGSVPEIHNLFAEEWSKRWDKHRHLPEDHWQEIRTYIDLALEGSPMPSQPITLKQLQHTLRSKKARSATGMDGVSKQDLVHAPEHLQESLTQLLNDVEISGNWPEQLLHGAIHSLAKVPNAEEVGQLRPVTVLPMMYRVWSSIRSRQILAHLGTVAPPTMLGNMPHKDAPTFWWQLQLEVENAQLTDMPMAGVTTDLIKAFNGLPREPIFHAARKLGIPECILRAWKAAAAGIQRHFYVRDQPGPALTSVTGFVEGCGMSVCAMAIYCLVLHSYAANKVPRAVMYSYVDNLEFLSGDPDAACEALEAIAAMTEWMGVPIDRRKTFAWGTTAPLRRTLEDQVPLVMLSAKDLGGHLQFSGKQTNFSVKSKCQDLQWLWRKLAQSRAPLTQKLKVLTTVAWPRAFHSASIVHLSDAILTDLRRDAVKALGISKSGLNPQVFLSLQGNALCDPGFFILWDALSKFRRFANASLVEAMLSQVAWTPSRIKRPGPIGVLTSRLSQIGWAWSHETQFRDHTGECIDIMHCPIQELRYRVKRSWHHMVGHLVMERKGYAGIQTVDAWTSVMTVPDLSPEENGLLRTLQAGTFMTNDHLQPAGLVDSKSCKFCGQDDSMEHRHWHCQETQSLRNMLPPDVLQVMHTGPACARERGWFCEPVALQTFKSSLRQISDQTQVWEPWSCPTETVDLFTDGTCVDPILPTARLTAWAVVMGGPGTWQACHFLPLAGGVPGQWQTVHRAEATALLSALQYASHIPQAVRIWCDNAAVLRKALALQQKRAQVRRTDNDHDIWESIQQVLYPISHRVTFHKVDSHQDRSTSSPVEEWIFAGNQAADDLAAQTLRDLNPTVVAAQREAARAIRFSRKCQQEVMRFYAKAGIKSVIWNQTHEPDQVTFGQMPIADEEVLDFRALAHQAEGFPARFKTAKFSCTLSWLHFIHDPMSPPVWVTWYELLWSFQMFTGSRGVQKVSQTDWALFDLMKEYDTPSASRSMAYYLTSMYRQLDPDFCSTHTKPDNYRWQHWAMCIPLKWSVTDKTRVRQWMQEQLGSKQLTQLTRDTSNLPPATDACVAPLPYQPSPVGLHRFFRRVG